MRSTSPLASYARRSVEDSPRLDISKPLYWRHISASSSPFWATMVDGVGYGPSWPLWAEGIGFSVARD